MKRWSQYAVAAGIFLVLTVAFLFIPIGDFIENLQDWETAIRILSSIATLVFGFLGWSEKKKEQAEQPTVSQVKIKGNMNTVATDGSTALGDSAQMVNNSTVHGDVVGPGATSRSVNIKSKVDGSTIITGDNNRLEKK